MNKLLLIVSALSALASAELCFNEYEVAGACTVGSDLATKMMSALYQCDYPTYTKKSGDEDWHDALNRRGLNRQDNCHDVADIEQEFYTYMSCKYEFHHFIKVTQPPFRRTLSLGTHRLVQPDQHWLDGLRPVPDRREQPATLRV